MCIIIVIQVLIIHQTLLQVLLNSNKTLLASYITGIYPEGLVQKFQETRLDFMHYLEH